MKFRSRFWLLALALMICLNVGPVMAADAEVEEAAEEEVIPDSTEMTLGVKGDENVMPEGFRGTDSESGDLQWLEDVGYLMQENSDLYNVDAAAIAESASFESEPNINWEVKKENDDGNMETESTDNTNKATNDSNIKTPGYYQVHNGGARLVSTPGGAEEDETTGSGSGSSATSGSTSGEDDDGAGAEGESKTVTAQQRVGIRVHDCTSPDIWVAFQEGAGKVDMAESEEELKMEMATKIIENQGKPFSKKAEDFRHASYIFIEEGNDDERDRIPWEKTARLSIAGPLFNERGQTKFESGVLTSKIDQNEYTNSVNVVGGEDKSLKGVYVRRNVPFIFAAVATDNGNDRATSGLAEARIEYADGGEVEKNGESYLFRVPNYPRNQYADQPEYYFSTSSVDKDGNVTTVRMPLYIVDTQAAFEGGRNQ